MIPDKNLSQGFLSKKRKARCCGHPSSYHLTESIRNVAEITRPYKPKLRKPEELLKLIIPNSA